VGGSPSRSCTLTRWFSRLPATGVRTTCGSGGFPVFVYASMADLARSGLPAAVWYTPSATDRSASESLISMSRCTSESITVA